MCDDATILHLCRTTSTSNLFNITEFSLPPLKIIPFSCHHISSASHYFISRFASTDILSPTTFLFEKKSMRRGVVCIHSTLEQPNPPCDYVRYDAGSSRFHHFYIVTGVQGQASHLLQGDDQEGKKKVVRGFLSIKQAINDPSFKSDEFYFFFFSF